MNAVINLQELEDFLKYLSNKTKSPDKEEVEQAIQRFLKEQVITIDADIIRWNFCPTLSINAYSKCLLYLVTQRKAFKNVINDKKGKTSRLLILLWLVYLLYPYQSKF